PVVRTTKSRLRAQGTRAGAPHDRGHTEIRAHSTTQNPTVRARPPSPTIAHTLPFSSRLVAACRGGHCVVIVLPAPSGSVPHLVDNPRATPGSPSAARSSPLVPY